MVTDCIHDSVQFPVKMPPITQMPNLGQMCDQGVEKPSVLHLVGSPSDDFTFHLNVFYAGSFNTGYNDSGFNHWWAIIRPIDRKWALIGPDQWASYGSWVSMVDLENQSLVEDANVPWLDIGKAATFIREELRPVFALPHLFCFAGMTEYRFLLENLNIPFIGSASMEAAAAQNKALTRALLNEFEISVPPGKILNKSDFKLEPAFIQNLEEAVGYPCVVKPTNTENSMGISLVHSSKDLIGALETAFSFSNQIIIDKFIRGREIRCSVVEKRRENGTKELVVFHPQEYIIAKDNIRVFSDKLAVDKRGMPTGKAPSTITNFLRREAEPELFDRIQRLALRVHTCLNFRDFSTIDVRVDESGQPYVLEANLFCSFGAKSLLNIHAKQSGWTDEQLFQVMAKNVIRRQPCKPKLCPSNGIIGA